MLFHLSSWLIRYRVGEHFIRTLFFTEWVAVTVVAWYEEAFQKHRLWWLPEFIEREAIRWNDDTLAKVLGKKRHAQDFRALLGKRNLVLKDKYSGD